MTVSVGSATARPESTGAPLVRMSKVNKHFGDLHVLKDIDLDVKQGEVVVVLGPSGSGKSTLIRTLNRLEGIESGSIEIGGRELPREGRELTRLRSGIGMVFQSFNLISHMSILDNVTLGPRRVKRMRREAAEADALALLERVGISAQANKLPSALSGGQQQRAAIARTLAMHPDLILFDEPTSALDPEMIREVLDVMRELAASGMTMVVVTHEIGFARSAADRIVFMDAGAIVEDVPVEEFFPEPASERARDFLSKILNH